MPNWKYKILQICTNIIVNRYIVKYYIYRFSPFLLLNRFVFVLTMYMVHFVISKNLPSLSSKFTPSNKFNLNNILKITNNINYDLDENLEYMFFCIGTHQIKWNNDGDFNKQYTIDFSKIKGLPTINPIISTLGVFEIQNKRLKLKKILINDEHIVSGDAKWEYAKWSLSRNNILFAKIYYHAFCIHWKFSETLRRIDTLCSPDSPSKILLSIFNDNLHVTLINRSMKNMLLAESDKLKFLGNNGIDRHEIDSHIKELEAEGFNIRNFHYGNYYEENCFAQTNEPYPYFLKKIWDCFSDFIVGHLNTYNSIELSSLIPSKVVEEIKNQLGFVVKTREDLTDFLTIITFQVSVGHFLSCSNIFNIQHCNIGKMREDIDQASTTMMQIYQRSGMHGLEKKKESFPLIHQRKFESKKHQDNFNQFQENLLKVEKEVHSLKDYSKYASLCPSIMPRVTHT